MSKSQEPVVTTWNVQQLLDTANLGYCILNMKFEFQSVDDAVIQITGFDINYLTSHNLKDLIPATIPGNYQQQIQTLTSDVGHHMEIPIQTPKGKLAWVVLTCLLLDD
jgi:PAS domain S-box-containing protein